MSEGLCLCVHLLLRLQPAEVNCGIGCRGKGYTPPGWLDPVGHCGCKEVSFRITALFLRVLLIVLFHTCSQTPEKYLNLTP